MVFILFFREKKLNFPEVYRKKANEMIHLLVISTYKHELWIKKGWLTNKLKLNCLQNAFCFRVFGESNEFKF